MTALSGSGIPYIWNNTARKTTKMAKNKTQPRAVKTVVGEWLSESAAGTTHIDCPDFLGL
jgi:hypothetical protein